MKNFVSVSTNAARFQDISLNPQKLAGMCAKLKCCLNYEVDSYVEANKKIPPKDIILQTADGDYHLFKTDILAGLITYSTDKNLASNMETITTERAREIIEMNRRGEKPLSLQENGKAKPAAKSSDLLAEADLSRFDKAKKKKKNKNRNNNNRRQQGDNKPQGNNAPTGQGKPQGNKKAANRQPKAGAKPQPQPQRPKDTDNAEKREEPKA